MTIRRELIIRELKSLDQQACAANSLWHQLESIKMTLARAAGISDAMLKANGIHVEGAS